MKKGNLKNWKTDGSEELELFFAQRLNELLFDYTLDSYKYYALNINLLLFEALRRINKIKNDLTEDINLKEIVEEINLKARTDIVTKSILGPKYQIYFPLKIENNKSKFKIDLEILSNKLSLNQIIPELFRLIEKEFDSGSKINLNILASQFVTALINVGFHQSYIYHQVNFYFFGGRLQKNRGLTHFFKYFKPEKKDFTVYVKVSDSFNEIKEICSKYKLEILNELELENCNQKTIEFISSKNENEVFAKCTEIIAFDSQSARLKAIKLLNVLASFFSYFHHKNPPTIDRTAVIFFDNKHFLIEPTTSPMAKGEDMSHKAAAEMLESFLKKFGVETASRLKFNRAVNLHSLAIQSDSNENRLLNLWITYETLYGTGKTTTVVHIINSLGHITSLKYFERIFNELSKSIYTWNKDEFEQIKELTGESSDTNAICSFCVSSDYENERKSLYSKLNEFPLLRFRIDDLNKNLNSTKKILSFLEKHNQRIKWHIKRLYRTRNNIVHDGKNTRNLDILVENAHSYFDTFMDEFILDNIISSSLDSIPQAVSHYRTLNENWIKVLKDDDSIKVNKDNFEKYLLFKKYCS
ncbi:HEPN domain-containing protein [Croceitalea sp. P059]|uniref:HEPN domain-containing protein n=1 Tax=Croceitalea sp. P059 TaxID=3075601 RepID=UPI002887E003|nr:HEPN domain-containing protein [Croceitalea sp. P059]MDT0539077.1 HEPN domain-containing protein [Croceitalea sp. P059]